MKNYKIVVIDQKRSMKKLKGFLEHEGFNVSTPSFCRETPATAAFIGKLARLDILLPEESMAPTLTKIHAFSGGPFFIIAARIDTTDQLIRLEKGIRDTIDRLVDPAPSGDSFKTETDSKRPSSAKGKLVAGPFCINSDARRVFVSEAELHLTPTEFRLLKFLASNPEKVFTRNRLLALIYGPGAKDRFRALDCHIANLRKKISRHLPDQNVIRAVYGTGYTFRMPEER